MTRFVDWIMSRKQVYGIDKVWLCGHAIWACDLLVLHQNCARADLPFGATLAASGVEAVIDTRPLADAITKELAEQGTAVKSKLSHLYQHFYGHSMGEGDSDDKVAHAHDARGDAHATLLLLKVKDFLDPLRDPSVYHARKLTPLLEHLSNLVKSHIATSSTKKGTEKKDDTPTPHSSHPPLQCRITRSGKHEGYFF